MYDYYQFISNQPKGKKYLAVLDIDTKADVIEPVLKDEDDALQMEGLMVFVEEDNQFVIFRLLEELIRENNEKRRIK